MRTRCPADSIARLGVGRLRSLRTSRPSTGGLQWSPPGAISYFRLKLQDLPNPHYLSHLPLHHLFGQAVAPDAHGIVLMDKAGWHTSGDLVVPENLSLVFLPPYSPELNPIERLWLHLRDNRLSHCVFQTTDEIVDTCCEAWNWLLGQTGRIRSLCSHPWLKRVSS